MNIEIFEKKDLIKYADKFQELYSVCYNSKINNDIIKYRFIDNLTNDLLMCVAIEKNRIVGNCCALQSNIVIDDIVHKAAIDINTMTHPNYEGKGIFTKLSKTLYDFMRTCEYEFVYGFPNPLSNRIYCKHLDWKNILQIPTLEFDLENKLCCIEHIGASFNNWDSIRLRKNNRIHIQKTHQYYEWRYQNNPEKKYQIINFEDGSWVIYHIYKNELNITEFNFINTYDIPRYLRFICNLAIKLNIDKITTWCPFNCMQHFEFEKFGFVNKSPVRYFGFKNINYTGSKKIYSGVEWDLYMGDDNVY